MIYELVSFDLWFTLITDREPTRARHRHRVASFIDALAESGQAVDESRVGEVMRQEWKRYHRVHFETWRTLSNRERIDDMTARLGCRPLPDALAERLDDELGESLFARAPVLVEGMVGLLRDVAERSHLVLISDTSYSPGSVLRRLLDDAGVLDLFVATTFSDELGRAKPDPAVFEHTAGSAGFDGARLGSRAVHIGDREQTDIKGAKAAGWDAALFLGALPEALLNRYQGVSDATEADVVATSVDELRAWLFR